MANRFFDPVPQALNGVGTSLADAELFFFTSGTSAPQDTFSDNNLTSANANPVVADGDGRFPNIFLKDATYKVQLKTTSGTQIWERDPVSGLTDAVRVVTNIAAMKALNSSSLTEHQIFDVTGYTSIGDGGGGQFYWDSTSTSTVNLGTIFVPDDNATGRFKRIFIGSKLWLDWFGAVGDGNLSAGTGTDDSAAIQSVLDTLNGFGGGTAQLSADKIYRKADTSATLITYSNTVIAGEGNSSVLYHDDKSTNPRMDMLSFEDTSNVSIENMRISGNLLIDLTETNQSQTLIGGNITDFNMSNVKIENMRFMATSLNNVINGTVINCTLDTIARDGFRFTNSSNIKITDNYLKNVSDDSVALHTRDADTLPGGGHIVSNNVFEACQGIKVLGAKMLIITGNIMRRTVRSPISIQFPDTATEGNTTVFDIKVCDNIITDSFGSFGTDNVILIKSAGRSTGALSNQPGVDAPTFPYNYTNNLDSGTNVKVGMWSICVENNQISRTLPAVTNYSDYGYGLLFDKEESGFFYDPAITETDFQVHGINVEAPAYGVSVCFNSISGCGTGFTAIFFQVNGSANVQDFSSAKVQGNTIIDCPGTGFSCSDVGTGNGSKQIVLSDNIFDLDPFFRAATHNSDNTWSSIGSVPGIKVGSNIGIVGGGNVFKNLADTGFQNAEVNETGLNIIYCDFVGAGDNASNKGVRSIPKARGNLILPITGDPTSSTYGSIENDVLTVSNTIPSAGRYVSGHFVAHGDPSVVGGGGGNDYIIAGWQRLTTGNGHVLNTDWVETRTLTGT